MFHCEGLWQLAGLMHKVVHHLREGQQCLTLRDNGTHLIRSIGSHTRAHALFEATRTPPNKAVPLKAVVTLDMFGELCKRVACS